MITKLQITGKLHYHRKFDFQLSKRKLGYRTLLPLTAPIDLRYEVSMRVNAENEASHVAELTPSVKAVT